MNVKHKKRIRLKNFDYSGRYRYFITICTHNKKPIFDNSTLVEWLANVLRDKADSCGFTIWAYCFMPDHLHVLIEGRDNDSDMRRFISSYKQYTGFHFKKEEGLPLWQINYYEHVLRKEEETMSVARYIFANPVRKGLVDDYRQYGFLGSFELDAVEL